MNGPHRHPDLKPPGLFFGIVRLQLRAGDVWDFDVSCIVDVFAVADCCGSPGYSILRMESGRDHEIDHPFSVVKALVDQGRLFVTRSTPNLKPRKAE